ncbi:MAG: hypothetical protein JW810_00240 [Sedimentisphaerales bacterium]|nr:hypothetical protein [Sedimentisphaerales bacterium]
MPSNDAYLDPDGQYPGDESLRLPSLPDRLAILERISTEAINDPHVSRYRRRAQFVFFCGQEPADLGGYEGQLEVVGRCLEWFVFDYAIAELEATPAEYWYLQHAETLSESQRRDVSDCLQFVLGLFEVAQVRPEEGFLAVDLLRPAKRYAVRERLISTEMEEGHLLLGRLFPHRGGFVLSGMAALMDRHATDQIRDFIAAGKMNPQSILAEIDGVELENLFGRSVHESTAGLERGVLFERLGRFLNLIEPGEFTPARVEDILAHQPDALKLTAQLCDHLRISCRHEIDLLFVLIDALLRER